jgi:hypothetical protein
MESGAVAQLGERCVRNAEVEGSTPFRSTRKALFTNSVDKAFSLTSIGILSRDRKYDSSYLSGAKVGFRVFKK